jgi:CheY-like chemotaxis protein
MSHELRTPLNAILNLTGFITQETVNPEIKKNSEVIALTSSTLLDSINNILDYYKIENGELKFTETPFSLEKVLSHINKNVKKQAELKKLSFKFYVSGNIFIFCFGDPHRLKQVISIAISNALKYTLKGKIELHIEAEIADNNNIDLTITIKDTGVGMNNERLKTVFQFINVIETDNKRNFGGFGLGLYIAKKIIAIQKGSINIVSNLKKGTSCIIKLTFPVVSNTTSKIPETDSKYNLIEKNILVIEDNEINQLVIKMITKNWLNTTVSFANNGQLGIAELQQNKYDIVLMDLQMPVMDGFEATTIIRSGGAGLINKNIPIIAVSADTAEKTKQRVIEIGMNHYLSKPLNKDILYKTINDLLKKEYLLGET